MFKSAWLERSQGAIAVAVSHDLMLDATSIMEQPTRHTARCTQTGVLVRSACPDHPNRQAVFKCMIGSYPLWASTYLGILVGCIKIEDGDALRTHAIRPRAFTPARSRCFFRRTLLPSNR